MTTLGPGDDGTKIQYVTMTDTIFRNNHEKGMYVESLSDATFTDVQVIDNGVIPGAVELSEKMGAGLDINLKDGIYSNLTFNNLTVTGNGLLTPYGAGIMIKARGTGSDSSYSSWPAILTNVTFNGGTFTGNERGIRFGEPGKGNTGPTNVTIHNASISGNVKTYAGSDGSAYGGLVNETTETLDATHNWWGAASGPTSPSNPGGTGDAVSGNVGYAPWYTDAARTTLVAVPVHNVTKNRYYVTIQAAIDAASPGDTINAAAGTYVGKVTVNKTLTLNGANAGISAGATPGARGPESIIQGGVQIQGNNVVLDGFKIDGPATIGQKDGIYILGGTTGLTVANNILAGNDNSGTGPFAIEFGMYTSAIAVRNNDIGNWRSTYINPTNLGSNLLFEGNNFHNNYVGIGSSGLNDVNIQFNKFTSNTVEGWGSDTVGSNVRAHYNDFIGNGAGVNWYSGQTIDATLNWWGNASGPSGAGPGTGDAVSTNVLFDPWTGKTPPTVTSVTPNQGHQGQTLSGVVIAGTGLVGVAPTGAVSFGSGVTVTYTVNSATQITANVSIAIGAPTGANNVSVTTSVGPVIMTGGFTVVAVPPPAPALISPAAGGYGGGTSVTFTWAAVTGATQYYLIVSTSPTLNVSRKFEGYVTGTSKTVTGFASDGTTYYWSVWTIDDGVWCILADGYANARAFYNIAENLPAAPVLISPAAGGYAGGTSVTFTWAAVTGATQYYLIVSKSPTLALPRKFEGYVNTGTSKTVTGFGNDGTTYYWSVWSIDDGTWCVMADGYANTRSFVNGA